MKKIVICMNLACVVSIIQASEKKSEKINVKSLDELRTQVSNKRSNFNDAQIKDFEKKLDTKSKKISFEHSQDPQRSEHQK